MKLPSKLYGFTVTKSREMPELSGTLWYLTHDETGLELVWLDRAEENKTFGIAFQTLPSDDTGVFHILEHSVLCGSDRYPVREPFVELMKNSMNTFLNAMTFPDKTFYPISSRNDKDFLNLTRVYLDAVFHPLIYSKPEIFRQEGWRYERDESGKLSYKGVVFNEMKGAMADPDDLTDQAVKAALFPQSPYRFNSGGDPARIPDLTYEGFLDNHRKHYSPSNGYVFLDGAVDIDAVLSLIQDEYLKDFQRGERLAPVALQSPIDAGTVSVDMEISAAEDPERKARTVWAGVIGTFADREKLTAMQVLSTVLAGDNQAPLCRAILSRGLAEDVSLSITGEVAQPWYTLEARNCALSDVDAIGETLREELERLCREGLDKTALEAALTNREFKMRERDYGSTPQGLWLGCQALETWLYGGDPAADLEVGDLFDRLREKLAGGWFEQLIREVLLDNPHRCQILLKPSSTVGEARRLREEERLLRESAAWTDADRARLEQEAAALAAFQETPDSPEDLAKLPHLTLADIPAEPELQPTEERVANGIPVLYHKVNTNGIIYGNLYFDAGDLGAEELSALSFLCQMWGELGTRQHTARQVNDLRRRLCGSLSFNGVAIGPYHREGQGHVLLVVSFSALERNLNKALNLVLEILTSTKLEETPARELLRQSKLNLTELLAARGDMAGLSRISAQISPYGAAQENMNGVAFCHWLGEREKDWDWGALSRQLSALVGKLPCLNRLTLSVTGADRVDELAAALSKALPAGEKAVPAPLAPWGLRREGVVIPSDVAYAVRGGSILAHGGAYRGEFPLASRIVTLAYLWNVIRVQGGAYGCGLSVGYTGMAACHSFRDPNAAQSLESFSLSGEFLRQFCAQPEIDLTGFIIGAVSSDDPLLTPRMKGERGDRDWWHGITDEDRRALRRALLAATPAALTALADSLEKAISEGGEVVVGSRPQVEACGLDCVIEL